MAWREVSTMSARREFVSLAMQPESNVRELCRRFGISPTTGYKWIDRGSRADETYLDRSRRPHHSPHRTAGSIEQAVLAVRDAHPVWNARKIRRVLQRESGEQSVPAASTIGQILKRNGRISEAASEAAEPWLRFEHDSACRRADAENENGGEESK